MRKSRILRRKVHHKGDAKIGIKLKKDYEICTNGKCQKRVRNLTKKQDVLESSKRNLFFLNNDRFCKENLQTIKL